MTQFIEVETEIGLQCINVDRIESFRQLGTDKETTELGLIPVPNETGLLKVHMPYPDFKVLLNAAGIRCS